MFSTSLLLLLAAASYVHGVKCESLKSLQTTVQKKPGETLSLSCRGSGFTFGSYQMHWIRKQENKPLVWVGRVSTDGSGTDYSKSFEGRIEITRDNYNSMVYLKLSGVTAEDTAVYYCARTTVAEI
ncbi:hypothetical protein C0J45_13000 [Silurus meridionalis]|nr:hypothetical protein C0J45_13000 [Silurus meridionalis]